MAPGDSKWTAAKILSLFGYAALGVVLLVVLYFVWRLASGDVATFDISDVGFTRGFITVLLLVVTLTLVLVVMVTLLFAEDLDGTTKRVGAARELLTPLLGILGTAIGFYFGTAERARELPTSGAQSIIRGLGGELRGNALLLDDTTVNDAQLGDLSRLLPNLEFVSLDNTPVTDVGLSSLGGLAGLRMISLRGANGVTTGGVDALAAKNTKVQVIR